MTPQDYKSLVKERRVFIIHGHDEDNLNALELLLKQNFKMDSVILNRLPDFGRTIIEKFEQEAESCCYAIALFTPDDHMSGEEGEVWQPRQNVMFELGWFCGRLGRCKVLFLKKNGTYLPSDFSSVLQKTFQNSVTEEALVRAIENRVPTTWHRVVGIQ